jgi:aminoglycoside phosphotransferase (APT) family kinase protein
LPDDSVSPEVLANEEGEQIICNWIEKNIGGKVINLERQGRWRPAWFVDVSIGNDTRQLYVRGARRSNFNAGLSLEREYNIHELLESGGIKVAHLHGYIPEIPAFVMDKVPGRHDLRHAASESDRQAVRRQLAREMAKMHRLDTTPFREAGLHYPATPLETTLAAFEEAYSRPQPKNTAPDPRLAFLIGWVRRNAPPARTEPRLTAYDAGQFMYDGPVLTAMMDFETAMFGDPLQDLAILRRRTTYEPMGDIPSLFHMYEEEMGEKLDLDLLRFHTVISSAAAVMGSTRAVASYFNAPTDDGDYVQYIDWVCNSTKQGFEGVAEVTHYPIPELKIPPPATTYAHDALIAAKATASGLDRSDPFNAYRRRTLLDNIAYMERVAAYGAQFADEYLEAATGILGRRPHDVAEADRLLETYVKQAGPEEDERLFTVLCADIMRRCFLLAIPGSTYFDGLTKPVQPLV